jgi:tetratricopeptide (TPR) repeat protein
LFLALLLIALVLVLLAFSSGKALLSSSTSFFILLFVLQYVLIVVHELGQALAARFLGFSQIRIIIGSGKPLFHFHLFGFAWLINRIPFGGLAYAKPDSASLTRRKWIFFAAGGLIVNGALALLSWLFLPEGALTDSRRAPLEALFWSNLIVIVENLAPYTAQTGFGPLSTDGKLLYDAIFYWNKPPAQTNENLPTWNIWTARVLKFLIVGFLAICTLALAALAYVFIFAKGLGVEIKIRAAFGAFFALLAAVLGQYTWRFYSQPVATKPRSTAATPRGLEWFSEFLETHISTAPPGLVYTIRHQITSGDSERAATECSRLLSAYPDDLVLLAFQGMLLASSHAHAEAEKVWDQILARSSLDSPSIYAGVYAQKLCHVMFQKHVPRFTASAEHFVTLPLPDSLKILHLDHIACNALYLDLREMLPSAEFCIRKALAPGNLTLQGSLGGLLVESGQFDEAEPHLRACYDRSPALHDKGISGLYLALIAEHRGDFKTAKTLAYQSIILYSEPWLTKKADALFARLRQQNS